jgi:hypothetical protein
MERQIHMELGKVVVRSTIVTFFLLTLHLVIFFFSAGRFDLFQAWFYFVVVFMYSFSNLVAQAKLSPELLRQRLLRKREGSKLWDEVLMRACNITLMFVLPFIAGLDVGRFRWSSLSIYYVPLGFALCVVGGFLTTRAMIENPHFEPTLRIQEERSHRVITT